VVLPARVADAEREALDGRRISTQGEFLNDKTIFLDNQVQNRLAGYHVLTPLRAQNGALVLVNRGWVALGRTRGELPVIAPITGRAMIEGRAALPPLRVYEIKPEAQQGRVWQNLQLAAMSKQMGIDLLPLVLRLTSDTGDGLARVTSSAASGAVGSSGSGAGATGMTAAKHRGYAFQWYSLAALTALLFVIFTFFERSEPHGPSS
jgi:surfeit locus 1 family protein